MNNKLRKWIALFLAIIMCIPTTLPALAAAEGQRQDNGEAEVTFNTGSYEHHMVQEQELEALLKDFSDKYGENYEGNEQAEAEAVRLRHYKAYQPDGSYEIQVEENAFFPYEVKFSYGGNTFCEWFMENGDSVMIGGHEFRVKSNADGKVVTKMSMKVGEDTVRVYPEEKTFTNDEDSLSQGTSLLPLEERRLRVDLKNYTPVELTKITFADVFAGETELPRGTSIMWKKRSENTSADYRVGSLQDFFDLYDQDLEIIIGEPDQLAVDNIRYLVQRVRKPDDYRWVQYSVCTGDDTRQEITDLFGGYWHKEIDLYFTGPKKDGQYFITLRLNPNNFEFDKLRFSEMKVFEGQCTEDTLGRDITSSIWGNGKDIAGSGYLMALKDNKAEQWITFVSYKDGKVTGCLPVELKIYDDFYSGIKARDLQKEMENGEVSSVYSSSYNFEEDGVQVYTYTLSDDYPVDGQYKLTFDYYRRDNGQKDNTCDEFQAYKGIFDSIQAAKDAGAEDVKATLFGDGYLADYSGEGVTFSIFIGPDGNPEQIKKYCRGKVEKEEKPEPEPEPDKKASVSLKGLEAQDGTAVSYVSSRLYQDGTEIWTYRLKNPHPLDALYTLKFSYKMGSETLKPGDDVMAYQGKYGSIQEAQAAGADNIRDILFNEGYTTNYSQGVSFSIFIGPDGDANQKKYSYMIKTDRYLSSLTSLDFRNVKTEDGTKVPAFWLPNQHDSYDGDIYTVFIDGKAGEPAQEVNLSKLVLEYTMAEGAKMYVNGELEGSEQTKPIDFSSKTVQFTVASEDGQNQKNYFVRIFKAGTEAEAAAHPAELYINSLDQEKSKTKRGEIVESTRELFLDSKHDNLHDILVANVGYTSMSALRVELKSDSIVLDDYWKLNGKYDLAGFTTIERTQEIGLLPNLAKVRLKAKEEAEPKDYGDLGTLSFIAQEASGPKTKMVLNLTGVVGDPRMTTTKIKNPTKYVPYGILITNNNTYEENMPRYSIIEGSLPEGMVLQPNGELYGVPMEAGKFEVTIQMNNNLPLKADTRTFQFEVLENSDDNVANAGTAGYELEEKVSDMYDTDTSKEYRIVSKGVFDEYTDIYIDGKKLKRNEDYTAESGSTRIAIIAKALPKSVGVHTIGVEFRKNKNQRIVNAAAQNYKVKKRTVSNPTSGGGGGSYGYTGSIVTPEPKPQPNPDPKPDPDPDPPSAQPEPKPEPVRKDLTYASKYTVKAGDTLRSIAKKFYGRSSKWEKIYDANNKLIPESKKLKKGMELIIPALNYSVKEGDSIKSIAKKYFGANSKWKRIYEVNKDVIPVSKQLTVGMKLVLPVPVVCTVHTVKKGDNLGTISKKYYGKTSKWKKIFQANKGKIYKSYRMKVGSQLHIPAMTCTTKKGDNLKALSKKYYGTTSKWRQIYDANTDVIPKSKKIKTGVTLVVPVPVDLS